MSDIVSTLSSDKYSAPATAAQVFHQLTHPRRAAATPDDLAALADAKRIAVDHRGAQLALWSWGRGLPVLLLHGWESRASHMAGFVPPLLQAGFRVLALDAPCHGESGGSSTDVVDHGRAVLSAVAAVGAPCAVIAHSAGSAAALYAFSQGLRVQASAHLAGPPSLLRVLRRGAASAGLDAAGTQQLLDWMAGRIGEPLELMDLQRLKPGLRHPGLILHDPDDREMPYAESLALAQAWQAASLQPVSQLGHRRILRAASVVASVLQFIQTATDGQRPAAYRPTAG